MLPEEQTGEEPDKKSNPEYPLPQYVVSDLVQAARKAAANSYSPYSHFPVGAAVLTDEGRIFVGTNIENSSYGLTICAERAAIAAAVSQGQSRIRAVAVYTDTDRPVPPCGACLQVIAEFADPDFRQGDIPIFLSATIKERWFGLNQLLPEKFNKESLSINSKEKP